MAVTKADRLEIEAVVKDLMTAELKRMGVAVEDLGKKTEKGGERGEKGLSKMDKAASKLKKSIGGVVAGLVGLHSIRRVAHMTTGFARAMGEVHTIVDDAVTDIDALRRGVLDLAAAQGTNEQIVARGLYQTISAGITDGAEALAFLEEANKLAVAGLAETDATVRLLASSMNAYGAEADQAADFSDVLFRTVQLGITTIPSLAGALGRATPLAAALGVEFSELNALIAALTKGGLSTEEAIVGLRSIMVSLLKPSKMAQETFRRFGIDTSVARVRTTGLVSVLKELREKVGDNSEAMSQMFENIRAIVPVLRLTGEGMEQLNVVLDDMANRADVAGEAFAKMEDVTGAATERALQRIKGYLLDTGDDAIRAWEEILGLKHKGEAQELLDEAQQAREEFIRTMQEGVEVSPGVYLTGPEEIVGPLYAQYVEALGMFSETTEAEQGAILKRVAESFGDTLLVEIEGQIYRLKGLAPTVREAVEGVLEDVPAASFLGFDVGFQTWDEMLQGMGENLGLVEGETGPATHSLLELGAALELVGPAADESLESLVNWHGQVVDVVTRSADGTLTLTQRMIEASDASAVLKGDAKTLARLFEEFGGWVAFSKKQITELTREEDLLARASSTLWKEREKLVETERQVAGEAAPAVKGIQARVRAAEDLLAATERQILLMEFEGKVGEEAARQLVDIARERYGVTLDQIDAEVRLAEVREQEKARAEERQEALAAESRAIGMTANALGAFTDEMIFGSRDAGKAFAALAASFIRDLIRMMNQALAAWIIRQLLGTAFGGAGGGDGGGQYGAGSGPGAPPAGGNIPALPPSAMGGVRPSSYQMGGAPGAVYDSETYRVAERNKPEMVVPLLNGEFVPVRDVGGSARGSGAGSIEVNTGGVHFHTTGMSDREFDKMLVGRGGMIADLVFREVWSGANRGAIEAIRRSVR